MRKVLIGEFTDEADILLNLLPLPLHLLDAVLTAFLLQSLQYILVLPNDLQQLPLSVWLIQSLLPALSALLIHSRVRGLASCIIKKVTFRLDRFNLLEQGLIFAIDLDIADLLQCDLLGTLLEEFETLGTLLAHRSFETV